MRSRALRRHLAERKKARTLRWMRENRWPIDARLVGMQARTPHGCSSYCCGNPRRHFKSEARLTMQERRAAA